MVCLCKGRRFIQWITVTAILLICAIVLLSSIYWKESLCFMTSSCRKPHLAQTEKLKSSDCSSMCLKPDCIQQANRILTETETSVEPCDDFFLFLCSNFESIENEVNRYPFDLMQSKLTAEVSTIIKNIRAPHDTASGKLKMVYDSCIDLRSEEGAVPVAIDFLRKIGIPDWPAITNDLESESTFLKTCLSNLLVHDEYAFVRVYLIVPDEASNRLGNLTIKDDWKKQFKLEDSEARYLIEDILDFFSLDDEQMDQIFEDYTLVETYIHDVLNNITDSDEEFEDIMINCLDPPHEWNFSCELVASIADLVEVDIEKSSVIVRGGTVPFLQNLFPFLHNCSKRTVANFLAIRFFINHLKEMNMYFRQINFKDPTRSFLNGGGLLLSCEDWIAKKLTLALGRLYVIENFKENQYNETLEIVENILEETKEVVRNQDWMSQIMKNEFLKEYKTIRSIVHELVLVYRNETFVEEYYREFEPTEGPFMENVLRFQLFQFKSTISMPWDVFDKIAENEFKIGGSIYGPIDIPFGTLLFPLYSDAQEKILNMAFVGTVIAHEIGHALSSWMLSNKENDTMEETITERQNCVEEQYSGFEFEGNNHMGNMTYREDSADQIGKKVIDNIIEKFIADGGSLKLPGVNYSTEQILQMISEALFCTRGKFHAKKDLNHSPGFMRVIGRVWNSKSFSRAFSCSNGRPMNPEQQCHLLD